MLLIYSISNYNYGNGKTKNVYQPQDDNSGYIYSVVAAIHIKKINVYNMYEISRSFANTLI